MTCACFSLFFDSSSACFFTRIRLPFFPLHTLLLSTSSAAHAAPFLLTNLAWKSPQALHSVRNPLGPLLHSGVSVVSHL